jgi:hypothetical protein
MHIYKYLQSHTVILQQHDSFCLLTITRVSLYVIIVQKCPIKPLNVALNFYYKSRGHKISKLYYNFTLVLKY